MSNTPGELSIEGLWAGYDRGSPVVKNVSMHVAPARITALIGANGAGKSTLLKSIMGYLKPQRGRILLNGREVTNTRPDLATRAGIGYLMEGHSVFPGLTIEENLLLAMWPWRHDKARVSTAVQAAFARAPILYERRHTLAGVLSGGQQRILELERLYATRPAIALMDEPSLGLSPKLTEEMFKRVQTFREDGITLLIIDQNLRRVAELADKVYVMQLGEIKLEGTGEEIAQNIDTIVKEFI